ncbi:MAG: holo-ACP synthase [Clostridia bacterium]|nr:holo-ACP synthase [Clostridia bacterium]
MPELRTGIDLCAIPRMAKSMGHARFMERVFTPEERAWAAGRGTQEAASLAGMWAAKEALCKALGTGIAFPMTDIGVTHTAEGAPVYALGGEAAARCAGAVLSLSVTHEDGMAAAVCVMLRLTKEESACPSE